MTSPPTPLPPPSSFMNPSSSTTPLYTLHKQVSPHVVLIRRSTDGSILLGTPSPSALLASTFNPSSLNTFSLPSITKAADPNIVRELLKGGIHLEASLSFPSSVTGGKSTSTHGIGAPEAAARILNHENLVILHGEWVTGVLDGIGAVFGNGSVNQSRMAGLKGQTKRVVDKSERWLVWDWCDAGSLKGLIEFYGGGVGECVVWGHFLEQSTKGGGDENKKKKKKKKGALPRKEDLGTVVTKGKLSQVKEGAGFLPESLVWHVALGVLRALMFLHEGKRDVVSVERDPLTGNFKRVRKVHASEGGRDVWGMKLGGFEHCYVGGAVVMANDEEEEVGERVPLVAMERDLATEVVGEKELRDRWLEWEGRNEGEGVPDVAIRPYTRGNDLYALGTILYHMMVGRALPPVPEECHLCGCHHVQFLTGAADERKKACVHATCDYQDVNHEVQIGQLIYVSGNGQRGKYSKNLAGLVGLLLRQYRSDEMRASDLMDRIAWKAYEAWRASSPDGRRYKDATDDMMFRKNNEIVARRNLAVAQQGGQVMDV
ncbi:unnamed protein product [Sordaria macrospora k-hell]|uniref:WGS project CABT00000000 data, contig 2.10 n=1 Tax=Sordaria macrospora (strain ATCC MYA-333 / DSM 997 / K(L3346) / K-hell) TaxID=771870 RepID=F7VW70_SORMK|nr:uncharacterized protein SMAC_03448 [Sordaria macrospora k-hell]CCC09892.1 unnamed protein product [Sordaria macrospora k-hell]